MHNLLEFTIPLTTVGGQALLTAEGAIEDTGGEGAFAGKEGMPKDDVEAGIVSFENEKMLEVG